MQFRSLYHTCSVANIPRGVLGTRVNVDIRVRYVWTGRFDLNPDTCGSRNFWIRKKKLRIQKYPDTCGQGRNLHCFIWCLICKYMSLFPLTIIYNTREINLRYIFVRRDDWFIDQLSKMALSRIGHGHTVRLIIRLIYLKENIRFFSIRIHIFRISATSRGMH